jgi:hypothetical protein
MPLLGVGVIDSQRITFNGERNRLTPSLAIDVWGASVASPCCTFRISSTTKHRIFRGLTARGRYDGGLASFIKLSGVAAGTHIKDTHAFAGAQYIARANRPRGETVPRNRDRKVVAIFEFAHSGGPEKSERLGPFSESLIFKVQKTEEG